MIKKLCHNQLKSADNNKQTPISQHAGALDHTTLCSMSAIFISPFQGLCFKKVSQKITEMEYQLKAKPVLNINIHFVL